MTLDTIRKMVLTLTPDFPIKKITLFGSRAAGTNYEDSDVDLIMEFYEPITLLTLATIKFRLEELLHLKVDIIHGPIQESDLIEIDKAVELYAA